MNKDKYINNTTQTSEGIIYKNENAFNTRKGICYMGEFALEMLEESYEDFTDEELIEKGFASTYDTIIEEVQSRWEEFDEEIQNECTYEEVARNVFNNASWTCISTEIDQMTY